MSVDSNINVGMPGLPNFSQAISYLSKVRTSCIEAAHQLTHSAASKKDRLPNTSILRMINGLEIEDFISVKTAILLRLYWDEPSTASALLSNCVVVLRDSEKKIINQTIANFIIGKINQGELTEALDTLYACMRFHDEGKALRLSDQFITMSQQERKQMVQDKELAHNQNYMRYKIDHLLSTYGNVPSIVSHHAKLQDYIDQNNPSAFKSEYMTLLDAIAESFPEGVEKFIFEELKETVATISGAEFFHELYSVLKTHELYSKDLVGIVNLTNTLHTLKLEGRLRYVDSCKNAFENSLHLLSDFKSLPCGSKTMYCLHHGLISQEWRKFNALFEKERHRFCNCHAVVNPKEKQTRLGPLDHDPFILVKQSEAAAKDSTKTVAIFGCPWGNGHKQTSINVAEILEEEGMHPVSIDIPDEMLADQDVTRKASGSWIPFSTKDIFSVLMQNKAYALINFLRWIGGFDTIKEPSPEEVRKTLQRLLLINPSHAITTIRSLSGPVIKAASLMGIPCASILTDVDRTLNREKPVEYAHYKAFFPYNEDVIPSLQNPPAEKPHQIEILGPPTKKEYDLDRSEKDVETLRKELETMHGITIPPGKKLIVIAGGGSGSFSPYPELLVKKYKGKEAEEIPFVAVVLCGNNTAFVDHVTKVSAPLPIGTIKPCQFLAPEIMEKLYRVASYGGTVIGKAGGLTVFETSKCGTNLIIDNIPTNVTFSKGIIANVVAFFNWIMHALFHYENQLPWEKYNEEFAISQGFGKSVASEEEFFTALDEVLLETKPKKLETPVLKFSERLPEVLAKMKKGADEDLRLKEKHIYNYKPQQAASLV